MEDTGIKQIFYVGMDAVISNLYIGAGVFNKAYGTIDIIHDIRSSPDQTDSELLMLTNKLVVSTCWSAIRLRQSLPDYLNKMGWEMSDIRIYELATRWIL